MYVLSGANQDCMSCFFVYIKCHVCVDIGVYFWRVPPVPKGLKDTVDTLLVSVCVVWVCIHGVFTAPSGLKAQCLAYVCVF